MELQSPQCLWGFFSLHLFTLWKIGIIEVSQISNHHFLFQVCLLTYRKLSLVYFNNEEKLKTWWFQAFWSRRQRLFVITKQIHEHHTEMSLEVWFIIESLVDSWPIFYVAHMDERDEERASMDRSVDETQKLSLITYSQLTVTNRVKADLTERSNAGWIWIGRSTLCTYGVWKVCSITALLF